MTSIITNRPPLISYPTHILTLQDVIVDSPVFRSNVQHLEDQVDLFEKWLEGFIRVLKSYIDALTKVNTQTSHLFKQLDSNKMNLASIGKLK
ncbi:uncharacterized protein BX664DRAFT_186199 [Halteromyces radiatus]|uniref:uncharacterized protein n=1 Tax=Halteromyces radiatus TaxID=101107 RepID=UPI002220BBFA|nr:uncharacterized protein BX664DRAFT_186199 [Halteromyces radiatus]KAI8082929.1 hypothetical protein BX664DRAFT_186199 [Halteromyces radiatus]